jgi:hypothetical protein
MSGARTLSCRPADRGAGHAGGPLERLPARAASRRPLRTPDGVKRNLSRIFVRACRRYQTPVGMATPPDPPAACRDQVACGRTRRSLGPGADDAGRERIAADIGDGWARSVGTAGSDTHSHRRRRRRGVGMRRSPLILAPPLPRVRPLPEQVPSSSRASFHPLTSTKSHLNLSGPRRTVNAPHPIRCVGRNIDERTVTPRFTKNACCDAARGWCCTSFTIGGSPPSAAETIGSDWCRRRQVPTGRRCAAHRDRPRGDAQNSGEAW